MVSSIQVSLVFQSWATQPFPLLPIAVQSFLHDLKEPRLSKTVKKQSFKFLHAFYFSRVQRGLKKNNEIQVKFVTEKMSISPDLEGYEF